MSDQLAIPPYRIVWDDFRGGFKSAGPDARWHFYSMGDVVADDGIVTSSEDGLRVISSGENPRTGNPAFVRSYGHQELEQLGLNGPLDHIKWLVHTTHRASTGLPGFDAVPGQVLTFETRVSGRTYGAEDHPFGSAVGDPEDDMRLGAVALPLIDVETFTIVTFFLTNKRIYATYERLDAGRPRLGNYASFLYAFPLAERSAGDEHDLAISYDRDANLVTWKIDGTEVHRLDRLGHHLPSREFLLLDHGGEETSVQPRQLNCGMGMFTILDAARPGESTGALVRITAHDEHYFDPANGEPYPQTFLDDKSLESNRVFGQGAELNISKYVVSSVEK